MRTEKNQIPRRKVLKYSLVIHQFRTSLLLFEELTYFGAHFWYIYIFIRCIMYIRLGVRWGPVPSYDSVSLLEVCGYIHVWFVPSLSDLTYIICLVYLIGGFTCHIGRVDPYLYMYDHSVGSV